MFCVDVSVHRNSVRGEEAGIRRQAADVPQLREEVVAVLDV
ncbi:hypothetical protein THAOC_32752, partial [Thalassiosira oceanica]